MLTTKINREYKKILLLLLAFIMAAAAFSTSFASAAVKSGASGTVSNSLLGEGYNGAKYRSSHYTSGAAVKFGIKSGSKTYVGYCLNPTLRNKTGTAYTAKTNTGSGMYKKLNSASKTWLPVLMVYGYHPGKGSPVAKTNVNDYYFATQVIAWEFTCGYRTSPEKRTSAKEYNNLKGKPAERCYSWILKEMAKHAKGASFTKDTKSGAKTYTMTYSYKTKKWSVTLTDANKANYLKKLSKTTDGLSVSRNGYKYTFSASKAGSYTAALANSGLGNYDGSENQSLLIWQAKSAADSNQAVSVGATDEKEFFVKFTTEKTGKAKVIKTSDSKVVQGFQFKLSCAANGYSGTFTTDKNGTIAADLYPGTYIVQETLTNEQKAAGYTEAKQTSVAVKAGQTAEVKVHNTYTLRNGGLRIFKETTDGGTAEGFSFQVKGAQADSRTLSEEEFLKQARPSLKDSGADISWSVDKEDLEKLNQAAKEGETGAYKIKISAALAAERADSSDAAKEPADSVSVTVALTHVKDAATENEEKSQGSLSWRNFSWAGSATLFEKEVTTNKEGVCEIDEMEFGTYRVTERMNEKQKQRYHQPEPQTVTLNEKNKNASVSVFYKNEAKEANLDIRKICVNGKISNIEMTVTGKTAWGEEIKPITAVTDDEGYIHIEHLAAGTYTVTESDLDTKVYVPQDPKTVVITGDESDPVEVVFENIPYTDVEVSKQSETTGEELPGALLRIQDKETGTVIEEWTSGETPHTVKGLKFGKAYILHEDLAPIGYACAQDITFTAGGTEKVNMVDEVTKLYVTKIDKETGDYLPGASFEILDADSKKLAASFTTPQTRDQDVVYVEVASLTEGHDYIIRETEAPKGYLLAKDKKITFKNKMKVAIADTKEGAVIITGEDKINRIVQTGDDFDVLPYAAALGIASTAGICLLLGRKKKGGPRL